MINPKTYLTICESIDLLLVPIIIKKLGRVQCSLSLNIYFYSNNRSKI